MLTFRQFLECNDIDTKSTTGSYLLSNFEYSSQRASYLMYCTAVAMESHAERNHQAHTIPPVEPVAPPDNLDDMVVEPALCLDSAPVPPASTISVPVSTSSTAPKTLEEDDELPF